MVRGLAPSSAILFEGLPNRFGENIRLTWWKGLCSTEPSISLQIPIQSFRNANPFSILRDDASRESLSTSFSTTYLASIGRIFHRRLTFIHCRDSPHSGAERMLAAARSNIGRRTNDEAGVARLLPIAERPDPNASAGQSTAFILKASQESGRGFFSSPRSLPGRF